MDSGFCVHTTWSSQRRTCNVGEMTGSSSDVNKKYIHGLNHMPAQTGSHGSVWVTVAQSLEDHLARREAPEGPPDVEEADDADHLEVLGVELRQHVAAELEEDRGEEEPVGGAEDEGRAAEAAPVADEVDAELEEEEGAKNGVDSAEELENRRICHLQELGLKYAGQKVKENGRGYNTAEMVVFVQLSGQSLNLLATRTQDLTF